LAMIWCLEDLEEDSSAITAFVQLLSWLLYFSSYKKPIETSNVRSFGVLLVASLATVCERSSCSKEFQEFWHARMQAQY
jgi:hypothetical protein